MAVCPYLVSPERELVLGLGIVVRNGLGAVAAPLARQAGPERLVPRVGAEAGGRRTKKMEGGKEGGWVRFRKGRVNYASHCIFIYVCCLVVVCSTVVGRSESGSAYG